MAGYTELLQTMLAMVIVSLLVINANRAIFVNNESLVEGELENQVIAIAQDFIEESRSTTFDATTVDGGVPVNIPEGFSSIGPGSGESTRASFNDFDDYDGWTESITTANGVTYDVEVEVSYYEDGARTNSKSTLKQMIVTVTSNDLTNYGTNKSYSFKFLRSFYAD